MVWIAVKLQTTGLSIENDQVVSIASAANLAKDEFYSVVKATAVSSPEAEKVHKVSKEEIEKAFEWDTVVQDRWIPWIVSIEPDPSKITFFAHNGNKFDFPMLRAMNRRKPVTGLEPYATLRSRSDGAGTQRNQHG